MNLSTATRIFGRCAPTILGLLMIILAQPLSSNAQTRNQLQLNNAVGYNNNSGAYRKLFYIPEDTLSTADSGAIAFKAGALWLKRNPYWVIVAGSGSLKSIPDDVFYVTQSDECVDTSFVGEGGLSYDKYERKVLPQFIGFRVRVLGPDVYPLINFDNGTIGVFYTWNKDTGELKIFWSGWSSPCGDQRRHVQVY